VCVCVCVCVYVGVCGCVLFVRGCLVLHIRVLPNSRCLLSCTLSQTAYSDTKFLLGQMARVKRNQERTIVQLRDKIDGEIGQRNGYHKGECPACRAISALLASDYALV